jgi:hypothetical protein
MRSSRSPSTRPTHASKPRFVLASSENVAATFHASTRRALVSSVTRALTRLPDTRSRSAASSSSSANHPRFGSRVRRRSTSGHEGSKALYLGADGSGVTVEEAVLQTFEQGGYYAENALYCTLFGLLFWKEIFAPIPGAFLHPFQSAPLDVSTSEFFESRRTMLLDRLEEISVSDVGDLVASAYRQHQGTSSQFARWEIYSEPDLTRAAVGLGGTLIPILDRIARHPGRHAKGMPDLLIWDGGRAVAVEVKGPGDQVRLEQRLWHDVMLRAGLEVRIARVQRKTKR